MTDHLWNLQVSFKIKLITTKMWSRFQGLTATWGDSTHFKKGVNYWISSLNLATLLHSTVILVICQWCRSWWRRAEMCLLFMALENFDVLCKQTTTASMSAFWTLWLSSRQILLKTIELFLAKLGEWVPWIKYISIVPGFKMLISFQ